MNQANNLTDVVGSNTTFQVIMRSCLAFLLLVFPFIVKGQTGNYFLSHYSPNKEQKLDNICFQMIQHENGLMYFATRGGVMEFDGRSWSLIQGKGAVYSLVLTGSSEIYWGGAGGYGKLAPGTNGLLEFSTLSENVSNVFQAIAIGEALYFLSEDRLYHHKSPSAKPTVFTSSELTGSFSNIFEMFGKAYVATTNNGLYRIDNDALSRVSLNFAEQEQILFSVKGETRYAMGVASNSIFVVNNQLKPRRLTLEDQDYIDKSVIVNAQWINDELLAIGTLRGGLIFVNANTGKTLEIINYSTGLPDNEIFALAKDRSNSIWAAHEYGFSRVAPYLPYRSFSHYPGLHGNLLCAITFNSQVYVGTSLGLYRLEREDVFEEITHYVDVEVSKSKRQSSVSEASRDSKSGTDTDSKRKGIFSFLKRNKNQKEDEPSVSPAPPAPTSADSDRKPRKTKTVKVKRTDKILLSSRYAYKKVSGIEAKVTHLVKAGGKLIAAGLAGTFEIAGTKARQISDQPSRFVYNTSDNLLLISTYDDEIQTLKAKGGAWVDIPMMTELKDQINYVFEGEKNELWFCALDKAYKVRYEGESMKEIQIVNLENPNYEEFVGASSNGKVFVVNTQGFFTYDKDNKSFVKVDSLAEQSLPQYFAHNQAIWYRDVHGWRLTGSGVSAKNLGFLNLFQNLRYLASDGASGNLWMITANNELFRFYGERVTPYDSGFPILLKTFVNGGVKTGNLKKFNVSQENSSVLAEIVQPDYLASLAIEYRYRLRGLEEEWSPWSNANTQITLPYLPAGDYILEAQSRDILGNIKDMQTAQVEVLPPYWRRPWFYALEFLVFASFVLLSFRLSSRYRIVSRLLMLLTIIMLIQFIETIVGATFETSTSPVIDFIIQVIIAMMVLPVEGYLREMMMRSLEKNQGLKRLLWQKQKQESSENIIEQ